MLPTRNFSSVLRFLNPKNDPGEGAAKKDDDRRQRGRFKSASVMCELGEVTNLSATGFRVCGKGTRTIQLDDEVTLTLKFYENVVTIEGKVVWAKTLSKRKYELGFELINLSPRTREALTRMALSAAPAATTPFGESKK